MMLMSSANPGSHVVLRHHLWLFLWQHPDIFYQLCWHSIRFKPFARLNFPVVTFISAKKGRLCSRPSFFEACFILKAFRKALSIAFYQIWYILSHPGLLPVFNFPMATFISAKERCELCSSPSFSWSMNHLKQCPYFPGRLFKGFHSTALFISSVGIQPDHKLLLVLNFPMSAFICQKKVTLLVTFELEAYRVRLQLMIRFQGVQQNTLTIARGYCRCSLRNFDMPFSILTAWFSSYQATSCDSGELRAKTFLFRPRLGWTQNFSCSSCR